MAKLKHLGSSLYELTPEMIEIGKMQADFYGNDAFNSRGSVYGEPWAPLNPVYAAWKAQHYPGRPMEVQTGKMRDSFGWDAGPSQVIIKNSAKTKNGLPLLALQQNGTSRGLPPRMIMALESTQIEKVKEILRVGIRKKIDEA